MTGRQAIVEQAAVPTLADIRAAAARIRPFVHRTPVLRSWTLDALARAELFFKCENLQRTGSFKARGAHNAVFSLSPDEAARGVVTHSSGNHGAAIALAARNRGIPSYVVAPEKSVRFKIDSIRRYGGQVTFSGPTMADRDAVAARLAAETGAHFRHPYDDPLVIAGQGTAALELLEEIPDLRVIVAPVGGGGLLSGTGLAARALQPGIRVIGAEPELADDALQSLRTGTLLPAREPRTIADGLRTSLSPLTFRFIRENVDDIVAVAESAIVEAMRLLWSILKLVVEPSSAVALAAMLDRSQHARFAGNRIGIILTGGNVDLDNLPL